VNVEKRLRRVSTDFAVLKKRGVLPTEHIAGLEKELEELIASFQSAKKGLDELAEIMAGLMRK
jgi:hypothetical protein